MKLDRYLDDLRLSPTFSVLSCPEKVTLCSRVCALIDNIVKEFRHLSSYEKYHTRWVTQDEVDALSVMHHELNGQPVDETTQYGECLNGRLSACEFCNYGCSLCRWSTLHKLRSKNDLEVVKEIHSRVIDGDVIPKAIDTKDTLLQRLGSCLFLDDIATIWPVNGLINDNPRVHQPRRRTEGIVVRDFRICDEAVVISLPNYTAFQRNPDNYHCRPMRLPVFVMGLLAWRCCYPWLTAVSRKCPPNHCQILLYYWLLKGHMGFHRDNSNTADIKNVINANGLPHIHKGHAPSGAENSQVVGSNVIVLTMGKGEPMVFEFRHPQNGNPGGKKATYIRCIRHQFKCGDYTISVLDPIDDFRLLHGVVSWKARGDASWHRVAYCYRWCQSIRDFFVDTCTMKLNKSEIESGRRTNNRMPNRSIFD